jgi:CBS-domain-containing membrane protein
MSAADENTDQGAEGLGVEIQEVELSDADIFDAMRELSGYIDITTEDFRALYHLAHRHAADRLFAGVVAGLLMRPVAQPLDPALSLDQAIAVMNRQNLKTLPVTDSAKRVVGILTETDVLRAVGCHGTLGLLARLSEDERSPVSALKLTAVGNVMTAPAVTLSRDAGFRRIMATFAEHRGRGTPVVDDDGCLVGLLLRQDVLAACHLDAMP